MNYCVNFYDYAKTKPKEGDVCIAIIDAATETFGTATLVFRDGKFADYTGGRIDGKVKYWSLFPIKGANVRLNT